MTTARPLSTIRVRACCATWGGAEVSCTWIVKLKVPVCVGVPVITLIHGELPNCRPGGNCPETIRQLLISTNPSAPKSCW